jgi:predicted Zn-dependent protease
VSTAGTAEIDRVPEGTYHLTVKGPSGDIIHQEVVSVSPHAMPLRVRLPEKKGEKPVSGVISVQRLQHKVPKAAKKQMEEADEAMRKGDAAASIKHLRKAIAIDPGYIEAHNNLGARLMRTNDGKGALESFRRALELDPSAVLVQLNIAAALLMVGDAPAAERAIRRTLDQRDNAKGRYLLGLALYQQEKFTDETLQVLASCESEFPNARLALAVVQANLGNRDLARETLTSYIADHKMPNRQQAMAMLNKLQ